MVNQKVFDVLEIKGQFWFDVGNDAIAPGSVFP